MYAVSAWITRRLSRFGVHRTAPLRSRTAFTGVGFTSTPGTGSEFWLDLPEHKAASGRPDDPSVTRVAGSTLQGETGRRYTIVYVEDNPSNIAFMQELIAELPCLGPCWAMA